MKRLLILLTSLCAAALFAETAAKNAAEPLGAFLERARRGNPVQSYAMLDGTLQHRRRGGELLTMPIYFGIIIQPERSSGQLLLDNGEGYYLGLSRQNGISSVIPMQKSTMLLDNSGVRASDLTLAFLFYKPVRELEKTVIGGLVSCRVVEFDSPEEKGELVRVALSEEYAFPLRAEFFRVGETSPWRTLECGGFTRSGGLAYAARVQVEGPGWRTRIDFETRTAKVGVFDPAAPVNVIRPVKTAQTK